MSGPHWDRRAFAFSLGAAVLTGCRPGKRPKFPDAYAIDAQSQWVHVDTPIAVAHRWQAATGATASVPRATSQLATTLGWGKRGPWFERLVDPAKGITAVRAGGQRGLRIHVRSQQRAAVREALQRGRSAGDFGARRLGEGIFAWTDDRAEVLLIGSDLRALATVDELARASGSSVRADFDGGWLGAKHLKRVRIAGDSGRVEGTVRLVGVTRELQDLRPAERVDVLAALRPALGVAGSYAKSDAWVRSTLGELKGQVDRQNFLVRGVLTDLLRRLGSTLRAWDGRVAAAIAEPGRVGLAFGTKDSGAAFKALGHLLKGLTDNAKTARMFGVDLPAPSFRRKVGQAGGKPVAVFELRGVRGSLPKDLRVLLDSKGRLALSYVEVPARGLVVMVVGSGSRATLERWVKALGAPDKGARLRLFLAADPETLRKGLRRPLHLKPHPRAAGLELATSGALVADRDLQFAVTARATKQS